jgi:hypothetical protein
VAKSDLIDTRIDFRVSGIHSQPGRFKQGRAMRRTMDRTFAPSLSLVSCASASQECVSSQKQLVVVDKRHWFPIDCSEPDDLQ